MLFFSILSVISFLGVVYLLMENHRKKYINKEPETPSKSFDGIYLKPVLPKPQSQDVDPNLQLLLDVINTAKMESWQSKIEIDHLLSRTYKVEINNHSNDIRIVCRIRMEEERFLPSRKIKVSKKIVPIVTGFHLLGGNRQGGAITYDTEDATTIILEFIWNNHIVPYHEKENSEALSTR